MEIRLLATTATASIILAISLPNRQALAQTQPNTIPISPIQAQQFYRDLIPSSSQDFFRQGQEQFEREIKILTQKRLFPPEQILKIERVPQLEGDLSPANERNILPTLKNK